VPDRQHHERDAEGHCAAERDFDDALDGGGKQPDGLAGGAQQHDDRRYGGHPQPGPKRRGDSQRHKQQCQRDAAPERIALRYQGGDEDAIGTAAQSADQAVDGRLERTPDVALYDDDGRQDRPITLTQIQEMGEREGQQTRDGDAQAEAQLAAMPRQPNRELCPGPRRALPAG
jgi:hypothetical protein